MVSACRKVITMSKMSLRMTSRVYCWYWDFGSAAFNCFYSLTSKVVGWYTTAFLQSSTKGEYMYYSHIQVQCKTSARWLKLARFQRTRLHTFMSVRRSPQDTNGLSHYLLHIRPCHRQWRYGFSRQNRKNSGQSEPKNGENYGQSEPNLLWILKQWFWCFLLLLKFDFHGSWFMYNCIPSIFHKRQVL